MEPPNFKIENCQLENNILKVSGYSALTAKEESSTVNLSNMTNVTHSTLESTFSCDERSDDIVDSLSGPIGRRSKQVLFSSFSARVLRVVEHGWSVQSQGSVNYFCIFNHTCDSSLGDVDGDASNRPIVQKIDIKRWSKIIHICQQRKNDVIIYEETHLGETVRHIIRKNGINSTRLSDNIFTDKICEVDNYCDQVTLVTSTENRFMISTSSLTDRGLFISETFSLDNKIDEIFLLPTFAEEEIKCRELLQQYLLKDVIDIVLNYLIF